METELIDVPSYDQLKARLCIFSDNDRPWPQGLCLVMSQCVSSQPAANVAYIRRGGIQHDLPALLEDLTPIGTFGVRVISFDPYQGLLHVRQVRPSVARYRHTGEPRDWQLHDGAECIAVADRFVSLLEHIINEHGIIE